VEKPEIKPCVHFLRHEREQENQSTKPKSIHFWCEKCQQQAQWEAHRIPGREYVQITVMCHGERMLVDLEVEIGGMFGSTKVTE